MPMTSWLPIRAQTQISPLVNRGAAQRWLWQSSSFAIAILLSLSFAFAQSESPSSSDKTKSVEKKSGDRKPVEKKSGDKKIEKSAPPTKESKTEVAPGAGDPIENGETPKVEKKKVETPEQRQKREAEAKEFADLERPLLKQIDSKWDLVQKFIKDHAPKSLSFDGIGQDPAVPVEADYQAHVYDLRLREVSHYSELTSDPMPARDAALKFLQAFVAQASGQSHLLGKKTIQDFAKDAIPSSTTDPMVRLYFAAMMNARTTGVTPDLMRFSYQSLNEVAPVLKQEKKYPRVFARDAHLLLGYFASRLDLADDSNKIFPQVIETWADWLVEMSADKKKLDLAWEESRKLLANLEVKKQKQVYMAMLRKPGIDPWLVHLIGGYYHLSQGWEYRGSDVASTVTKEGWKKLDEHQSISGRHISYAYFLQPSKPAAPASMMGYVLTKGNATDVKEWFLRTVKLRFDYQPAYESLFNYLRPRWGGSISEVVDVSKACLNSKRLDTQIPTMVIDNLIKTQQEELGLSGSIFDHPGLLQALITYADALELAAKNSKPEKPIFGDTVPYRSRLGALFMHGDDFPHARQVLLPIANQILSEPFYRLQHRYEYAAGLVLASTPELTDQLSLLDLAVQNGGHAGSKPKDFEDATLALVEVHKAFNIPENADATQLKIAGTLTNTKDPNAVIPLHIRRFLLHSEVTVKRLRQYSADEWVELTIDDIGLGWEFDVARRIVLPDGAVELTANSGTTTYYQLRSLANFKPPYEVQVVVERTEVSTEDLPLSGVVLGSTDTGAITPHKKSNWMRTFGVYPGVSRAAVAQYSTFQPNHFPGYDVPRSPSYKLHVKAWPGGHWQFSVNDQVVAERRDPQFDPGSSLLFGTGFPMGRGGTVKLSGMRIHRLSEKPPAEKEEQPMAK